MNKQALILTNGKRRKKLEAKLIFALRLSFYLARIIHFISRWA